VFAVGHLALLPLADFSAALIAVGPHAALSHRAAAVTWKLLDREEGAPIDVAVAEGRPHHRPGIRIHRVKQLDVRYREGLRVTSPAQTLASLAARSSAATYERAYNEALKRRLIRDDSSPGFTRSELELKFRRIIERSGLPTPKYNGEIAGREVDAVWHPQRYAIEIDSWQHHGDRQAFEGDRDKDFVIEAAGYRHARVTDRQMNNPLQLVARLATALAS
jgi:very-short-patch-repair endonuclease